MEEPTFAPEETLGKGVDLKKVFSTSFIFILAMALLSLIFVWTSTLFFTKPVVPAENSFIAEDTVESTTKDASDLKANRWIDSESLPKEILEAKILLHKDSQLFVTSPLSLEVTQLLPKVSSFALSNDRSKLAYIETYDSDYYTEDVVGKFFILDLDTEVVREYNTDSDRQRGISWSPDDKYVLVNSGTGAYGSTVVYSVAEGTSYCTFMNSPVWIDSTNVFVDYLDRDVSSRPWESGAGRGIKKMNILTCATEVFFAPTDTRDYSAVSMEEGNLVVQETYVQDSSYWWGNPSSDTTPYTAITVLYDPDSKELISETGYYEQPKKELSREQIKLNLSDLTDFEYLRIEEHPLLKNWFLVNAYKGGSIFNNEVYVINLLGPEIIFVTEKALAKW